MNDPNLLKTMQVQASHGRAIERLSNRQTSRALGDIYGSFMGLPGLRGLWYPGPVDQNGALYDFSGQTRTLTYNGNPQLSIYNDVVPYWDYDGTGDYHSRASEAGLNITGTEGVIATAYRGLTLGGWFWIDSHTAVGDADGFMGKLTYAGNQCSYLLAHSSANLGVFIITTDGNIVNQDTVGVSMTTGSWWFLVGRFTPSTEIAIWGNGTKNTNTSGIPATIFNSTAPFEIASYNVAANPLNGRCALAFLCAAALPDALISHLFRTSRTVFGV